MSTKDLKHFFGQFSNSLQVLAREGRHIELRSRMDMLSELLELWLSVVPKGRERPERFRPFAILDRFNGPLDIDIREVAKQGAVSADAGTVQTLADSFARLAFRCLRAEQYALAQEYLDAVTYLYYQCKDNDDLLKVVGDRLDTILDSLFLPYTYPESILQGPPSEGLVASLRFSLRLLYAAIFLRRSRDVGHFLERLLKMRQHRGRGNLIGPPNALSLSGNAVLDFVFVLVICTTIFITLEASDSEGMPLL